ncbi:MAG: hypothetical protein AB7S77_16515 [Desulfatirhabdiaceae bacterium]
MPEKTGLSISRPRVVFFVDVSMLYHIKDPYLVFTTIGPGKLYEDNGIIPKAEPALKETLGKLTTEYLPRKSVRKGQEHE